MMFRKQGKMPKRKLSGGRGALTIIAALFICSAVIRLTNGAGPAIAREVTALAQNDPTQATQCDVPPDISAIMSALQNREMQLDQRHDELQELERTLELARVEVSGNLETLRIAEENLSETIARSQQAAEGDLAKLTAVYENMKPKDAAGLFEEMTPEFAAGFISRMRPDAAAAVMTGLNSDTAYSISVILAGRNANAPKN